MGEFFQDLLEGSLHCILACNTVLKHRLYCRGGCYSNKPGNVGLVLRRSVVTGLREVGEKDVDLCCHGPDAPPKVRATWAFPGIR